MTRLSDSLRGLADRAPIEGMGVSTTSATRRIRRGRGMRAAANATAGAGAVAVIVLGAIGPGTNALSSVDAAARPESAAVGDMGGAPAYDESASSQLAWGLCGSRPFDDVVPMASDSFTLELGEVGAEAEGGDTITATLTSSVAPNVSLPTPYTADGPTYLVLWDGLVVGTGHHTLSDSTRQSTSDGLTSWATPIDLVNCWDGSPLPGGGYELVAYQDFYADVATGHQNSARLARPRNENDRRKNRSFAISPTLQLITVVRWSGRTGVDHNAVASGQPVGDAVTTLADDINAELATQRLESVRRLPVAMLFPLTLLILPGFLLLTIAPSVLDAFSRLDL